MSTALQNASARLETLMEQMSTGQKLMQPSDDPVTSVRLARLTRDETSNAQYRDNIASLKVRLQKNETSLSSMNGDLQDARDQMLWALDGGNSSEDLKAMTSTLQSLSASLLNSANSKDDEGNYLFSGTATGTKAISFDATAPAGSRYSFTGNTTGQTVVVGNGVTQTANVTADEMAAVLNSLDGTLELLTQASPNVNDPATRAQFSATLAAIDSAQGSLGGKIAKLGGAQNTIATLDNNLANVSLANKEALIDLGQLDYSQAATELTGYTSAVQATQKAYAQVSKLSLFDVV
jgi:flagellar hook-associated protein 3 FlgL